MSREARIWTLLIIDGVFLLLELVVGYAVGSLALIADSFHMLNDVMSLVVALYAIKLSTNSPTSKYSYGWHRAEILAALINGVFLLALCLSIFLEAIGRFFSPPDISNPKLIVIVGSLGLASNILGLFLFHDHGHSHDSGSASLGGSNEHILGIDATPDPLLAESPTESTPLIHSGSAAAIAIKRPESPSSLFGHPAQTRAHVMQAAEQAGYYRSESPRRASFQTPGSAGSHHRTPSVGRGLVMPSSIDSAMNSRAPSNSNGAPLYSDVVKQQHNEDGEPSYQNAIAIDIEEPAVSSDSHNLPRKHSHGDIDNHDHDHREVTSGNGGHGHSHGSMNMHALLLHVMGDALGNVGVIASGLIIWLTEWPGKYYSDPIISLVITIIIFASALPLVKSASFILLQGVPTHISLDALRQDIRDVPGVQSLHELHVWQLSESKIVASVHVWVSKDVEFMKAAAAIRAVLHSHGVHSCTIQPEFSHGRSDPGVYPTFDEHCLIPCAPGEDCPPDAACCGPVTRTGSPTSSH